MTLTANLRSALRAQPRRLHDRVVGSVVIAAAPALERILVPRHVSLTRTVAAFASDAELDRLGREAIARLVVLRAPRDAMALHAIGIPAHRAGVSARRLQEGVATRNEALLAEQVHRRQE